MARARVRVTAGSPEPWGDSTGGQVNDPHEERAPTAPPRSDPRDAMTAMMIIVAVVVFWTLFVLGVLVGISVYREATRRRTSRLDRDRVAIERDRADLEAEWRLVGGR